MKKRINKNILITGGSGYFGELLVKKLLNNGYSCSILDINKPDLETLTKVKYINADIRDFDKVKEACNGIDLIFHNVAQVPLAKNNELFVSVNYQGTKNILKAALENNCKQLIYTSSSAVYGVPSQNPVTEHTPLKPGESYGKAKLDGERECIIYSKKGLDITIIRPRTILGHGRLGIFQILFEWVYQGKNIPVFDGGNNIYQFVHADDLADASILAIENEISGIFNIGANRYCSMYETLSHLVDHAQTGSKVKSLPSNLILPIMKLTSKIGISPLGSYHALMYGKSMFFDTKKANNVLGFNPKYSNKEMIVESYDWYTKNRVDVLNSVNQSAHKSSVKQGILSILGNLL